MDVRVGDVPVGGAGREGRKRVFRMVERETGWRLRKPAEESHPPCGASGSIDTLEGERGDDVEKMSVLRFPISFKEFFLPASLRAKLKNKIRFARSFLATEQRKN